jgi:hypothetical protein
MPIVLSVVEGRAESTRYNVQQEVRLRALIFAHLGS